MEVSYSLTGALSPEQYKVKCVKGTSSEPSHVRTAPVDRVGLKIINRNKKGALYE